MEKLLEMAMKSADKAEVYAVDAEGGGISFENARLKDIESRMQSGVSLRVVKNGVQGFAYTRNLLSREELIQNALDSLKGGVEGAFDFPLTKNLPALDTYDPSIKNLSNARMIEECSRVCNLLSQRTTGQINVSASRSISSIRIINSSGTDFSLKSSAYRFHTGLLYPYTSASLNRTRKTKTFQEVPVEYLNFLAETYTLSGKEVIPDKKLSKVIFLPETVYVLMWRLQTATNSSSIHQNISPLAHKRGEKIFHENISVYNDPLNDTIPGARAVDDEGTPCTFFPVVENGVLMNFYYDLYFAHKMNALPSGHGFKGSVTAKPVPSMLHLTMTPGSATLADMVQSVDRGVIIAGALGAHSGNIPHGDFSIGVSPALYIENGEIIGNVKDVMISGNIYDTLQRVTAVENSLQPGSGGNFPALLIEDVHVTIRK